MGIITAFQDVPVGKQARTQMALGNPLVNIKDAIPLDELYQKAEAWSLQAYERGLRIKLIKRFY